MVNTPSSIRNFCDQDDDTDVDVGKLSAPPPCFAGMANKAPSGVLR